MSYKAVKDQTGVQPGHKRYRFDLRVNGRRERKQIVAPTSMITRLYAAWERDLLEGALEGPQSNVTFEEVFLEMSRIAAADNRAYCQMTRTTGALRRALGDMQVKDVTGAVIDNYLVERKHKISGNTAQKEKSYIVRTLKLALERGYIHKLPQVSVKTRKERPREVKASIEDMRRLMAAARMSPIYGEVLFALSTGMRRGELLKMTWNWIDLERGRIVIPSSATKTRRARVVALTDEMREYLMALEFREGVIFAMSESALRYHWNRVRDAVGLKSVDGSPLHYHDLRHLYAQAVLDAGADMSDVQQLLGHVNIAMTQRVYAPFARPDVESKGRLIERVIGYTGQRVVNDDLN